MEGAAAAVLLKYPHLLTDCIHNDDGSSSEAKTDNNFVGGPNANAGIKIVNYETTLPMKKGLSSSAAVCVLIVRAFLTRYRHNLPIISQAEIMELAYNGERLTPSRWGKMDQCVVMGPNAIAMMEYRLDSLSMQILTCKAPLYFVVADLKAGKDTVVILRDLNACFPHPADETQALMINYQRNIAEISREAQSAIEEGNPHSLAKCMKMAQELFDECAIPNCPSQLNSPKLHELINNPILRELSLVVKGVGSQGDGTAQILCPSAETQRQVCKNF